MRITNRDKLCARQQTGPGLVPAALAADAPAPAQADAAGPSAPRRHRRSGQRSRQVLTKRRRAAHVASQRDAITSMTATAPTGSVRFSGRGSPSACAAPRWCTSHPPAAMWRHTRVVPVATPRWLGTSPPPPTMSSTTAPPANCHLPLRMDTRSGISPACRTR
jgi:hypothetical protein